MVNRKPDFNQFLKVLRREVPDRPTLFEFIIDKETYKRYANKAFLAMNDHKADLRITMDMFKNLGYDFGVVYGSNFVFPKDEVHQSASISLNEGAVISNRVSYEKYVWPNPEDFDYSILDFEDELPKGMKIIVYGPGGVLENVISLVGFNNLCYMLYDDEKLVEDIFNQIGSRLVKYYELCCQYDTVGALIVNDDWGFVSQTMLSTNDMRKYVIPWHKKIVETIHRYNKPAILHSCGNLGELMEDVIDFIKYDAKHSYEDKIIPVEEAYEKWGHRIAILGGLDINFLSTATPDEIEKRCQAMLSRTIDRGGYALGSGNSIPSYIPEENYKAMIETISLY